MPRHPDVSKTTEGLSSRVFSALVPRIQARQEAGQPIYPLHVGDTWLEPLERARCDSLRTAEHPGVHKYPPPHGEPELLDAIARRLKRRHGVERSHDEIQVMPGATGALNAVISSLLEPGEEVIVPSPFWPLIRGLVAARGAVPVQVPIYTRLSEPGFDLEATLEASVTEKTAAIYVNSPNNPSGATLSERQLGAIARVAERHDLWILSDEVYEELYLDEDVPPPAPLFARLDARERTIASHSMSKAYGLAGARVGYTHGPADVMRVIRGVQTFLTYSAPRPMQILAARALDEGDGWLAELRRQYREQAERAAQVLDLPVPSGGTFLFFDAGPFVEGDDALPFLQRCVDEAGVILVPGASSGEHFQRYARLCFTSVGPEPLAAALEALAPLVRR